MTDLKITDTQNSDVDEIVLMERAIDNSKFILPNTKKEHINLIKDKDVAHLIIRSKNDKIVGFVILAGLKNKNQSIEFRRIVISQKGIGIGRAAIRQIIKYCFEKLSCHRLWLDVLESNDRAIYLYKTEGFIEEGKLRDCLLISGEFKSLIIMSILENEFQGTSVSKA